LRLQWWQCLFGLRERGFLRREFKPCCVSELKLLPHQS
jgi:hypothetical protein